MLFQKKMLACLSMTAASLGFSVPFCAGMPPGETVLLSTTGADTETLFAAGDTKASGAPVGDIAAFDQLQRSLSDAESSAAKLKNYVTILEIQEEVGGTLQPCEKVNLKIRREPFSVYMRWEAKDQEALFVEGENDDRVLVKPTKALATLRRVWRLDPESRMAKQSCRYPITDSGVEKLVIRIREFYAVRSDWEQNLDCRISRGQETNADVTVFDVQFKDQSVSPDFSSSRYFFDRERGLLVALENYNWKDSKEKGTLVERYVYHSINSEDLGDQDFDQKNPDYAFVAR